jgi:hypothetical protein
MAIPVAAALTTPEVIPPTISPRALSSERIYERNALIGPPDLRFCSLRYKLSGWAGFQLFQYTITNGCRLFLVPGHSNATLRIELATAE